jgi:hypothetical protein
MNAGMAFSVSILLSQWKISVSFPLKSKPKKIIWVSLRRRANQMIEGLMESPNLN